MKHLKLLLLLVLFSCSKNRTISTDTEISFDVDGSHYSYTGTNATAVKGAGSGVNTFYAFTGFNGDQSNLITLVVVTPNDTLKPVVYHYVQNGSVSPITSTTIKANNYVYSFSTNGNLLDINISSYQKGVVSGTFSGTTTKIVSLNPYVTTQSTITNGVIKNISIKY